MKRIIAKHKFSSTSIDGCMCGLTAMTGDKKGIAVRKSWKIAHAGTSIDHKFKTCDFKHDHTPCQWKPLKNQRSTPMTWFDNSLNNSTKIISRKRNA